MSQEKDQVLQGGHVVRIVIEGQHLGWARSAQLAQDYGTEGVYVISSVAPQEHIPLRWSAQITLAEFYIRMATIVDVLQIMELAPMGPEELLLAGVITFNLFDSNGTSIVDYEKCTITNQSYDITANALSGQNATFQAKSVVRGTGVFEGAVGGRAGKADALIPA